MELSEGVWKLAFSRGLGESARIRNVVGGDPNGLLREIEQAKRHFGLGKEVWVQSCYEAGRDGFWLHRFLVSHGIENQVVDSSSIEVNRRRRRAKTDRLDVIKLLTMLIRYGMGEESVWRTVRVPSHEDEDQRQLHRELMTLTGERTRQSNRIRGLLAAQGIKLEQIGTDFLAQLKSLRLWNEEPIPKQLQARLQREYQRLASLDEDLRAIEQERLVLLQQNEKPAVQKARRLMHLRGIGVNSAWLYVMEIFGWREIKNRRELASLTGLTPTPYSSGDQERDQGISKAGNRWVRAMAIEIAWRWLIYQPESQLTRWYQKRFGRESKRQRKVGIVALARKLLVALWRYLEKGEIPEGAVLVDESTKLRCRGGRLVRAT
jgi:transposase